MESDRVSVPRQPPLTPRLEFGALGLMDATSNDNDCAVPEIATAQASVVINKICLVIRPVYDRAFSPRLFELQRSFGIDYGPDDVGFLVHLVRHRMRDTG